MTHLLALLALAGPLGCAADSAAPSPTVDVASPKNTGKALYFEHEGTLTLKPGEVRSVTAIGAGPGPFQVTFSLLGDVGDAFVEASVVESDGAGVVEGVLHAPNQAATFKLRAAILGDDGQPGPGAELSVAVSDEGFGSLRVLPQYTGKRAVEAWTASVLARTSCADLSGLLPGEPEGALVASSSPNDAPLVENAPVGPNLAVAIRAGHYAWGCADVSDLGAGSTREVKVTIFDKPIVLSATNLDLNLEWKPEPEGFQQLADDASYLLREGFAPSGAVEAEVILDGMAAAAPADQAESFAKQRLAQSWDELALDHFAGLGGTLRERIAAWVTAGLPLQSQTFTGNLQAKPGEDGLATLNVGFLGGVSAKDAGIAPGSPFTWTADPSDALILKGLLLWQPSRFVGALALRGAQQDLPGVSSVPEALAQVADCEGLGVVLGSFASCDSDCLAALCRSALEARWASALSASTDAGLLGHITITAAGPATIDDQAQPVGFNGVWVGSIGDNLIAAEAKGAVVGVPPNEAPPP